MAQKQVTPPQFSGQKPGPKGAPDGHQTAVYSTPTATTMTDWVRQDQDFKESQPQPQYS